MDMIVHKRATAFAEALDNPTEPTGPGTASDASTTDAAATPTTGPAPLVRVARALGELPVPELRAEVKTVQRAQLMAAMEAAVADGSFTPRAAGSAALPQQQAEARGPREPRGPREDRGPRASGEEDAPPPWRRRLAVGGVAVGIAATGFGGVATASSGALPGDSLYGVKRQVESLRITFAGSTAERGAVHLDLASVRMDEVASLSSGGDVPRLRGAMRNFVEQAGRGRDLLLASYTEDGDLAALERLAAFRTAEREQWRGVRDTLPAELDAESAAVEEVLRLIDEDVAPLTAPSATSPGDVAAPAGPPASGLDTTAGEGAEHHAAEAPGAPEDGDEAAGDRADTETAGEPAAEEPEAGAEAAAGAETTDSRTGDQRPGADHTDGAAPGAGTLPEARPEAARPSPGQSQSPEAGTGTAPGASEEEVVVTVPSLVPEQPETDVTLVPEIPGLLPGIVIKLS
ncbi:DUF5667 domain-containing protein [Allostreptomyces psammosilenae]|uniref:DUF5667 domain-containing protein n=1 Tax=Allostreptomyces psammosilenae TaxID=1892865 RepID=A0A852ZVS8_9ACTN|nr:DUF5667 domain-containing protein [Allostreptomyces psammosilenae]NYI05757.1 hypothetical protein [Allostreptomyces psammosilenae]